MEVTNRINGSDLIDRVPDELWMEVCDIVQEAVIKNIPKRKKSKMVVWDLTVAEKRREAKAKEKRKDIPICMQSSKE